MKPKHIQHLYWRAGFSLNPSEIQKLLKKSRKEIVETLFISSKKSIPLQVVSTNDFKEFQNFRILSTEKKQKFQKLNRQKIRDLNSAWIERISTTNDVLRERMTLFWANHFVCKDQNSYHFQLFNNILRTNALGNFRIFVKEVAKSASMIKYLNTKQNKKEQPNENFARELMELFTLGIGNYSETDIKEAAKCFTGWNYKPNGDFFLRQKQHDFGKKQFFSQKGNFTGEDIIDIILQQKTSAKFICTKIYKYFVNTNVNKNHIDELVAVFYPEYDITSVMKHIFMSNWFYNEKNIGTKIKSPIDLLAGINKTVPTKFEKAKQLIYLQKQLGQELLNPVNVAGWKGGQHWIDTNTLMLRLKLPSILLNNRVISMQGVAEFEDNYKTYLKKRTPKKSYINIDTNWDEFKKNYKLLNAEEIQSSLIMTNLSSNAENLLNQITFNSPKDYCIQLMSLPEYQLC